MARGNPKPTEKTNWIPDDTTNIVPPSAGRKLVGWLFNIKPPAEIFNWFWNLKSRFEDYFAAQVEDWIVIDSDADEGDYTTLALYIADAPAAGDRILVKEDQTVTAQVILPANITLKFLDGSRLLCATNIATSVLKLGSNPIIEGVLNIVLSQTGVTGKAVEIDGDNATGKINVENSSTGTLTTGYHINGNKTGNKIEGFIDNTGGGVLTNIVVDNSTEKSNSLVIVDAINNIVISTSLVNISTPQTLELKTLTSPIINTPSSSGHVYGATYTPSETIVANIDSLTISVARYTRIGNIVTVTGFLVIDPTVSGVVTTFRLSLPIASSISNNHELSGVATSESGSNVFPWGINGDVANDEAYFYGAPASASSMGLIYTFSYEIL